MHNYFYEKRYYRPDGEVYVKRYSRSFEYGKKLELDYEVMIPEARESNSSEASASRARSRVRILAFSNPDLIGLLTLTFRDCPTELEAQTRFKAYMRKVRKNYAGFKYLGVRELQARGSIHYHLLVNFCPFLAPSPNNPKKRISTEWHDTYGFSDYTLIKGDDKWRTELYLLKYLGKTKVKLFNDHYVRSRNLDEIAPRYHDARLPINVNYTHIFHTDISNKYVDSFQIVEYTYNITKKE